jgi:hypothetical protein
MPFLQWDPVFWEQYTTMGAELLSVTTKVLLFTEPGGVGKLKPEKKPEVKMPSWGGVQGGVLRVSRSP